MKYGETVANFALLLVLTGDRTYSADARLPKTLLLKKVEATTGTGIRSSKSQLSRNGVKSFLMILSTVVFMSLSHCFTSASIFLLCLVILASTPITGNWRFTDVTESLFSELRCTEDVRVPMRIGLVGTWSMMPCLTVFSTAWIIGTSGGFAITTTGTSGLSRTGVDLKLLNLQLKSPKDGIGLSWYLVSIATSCWRPIRFYGNINLLEKSLIKKMITNNGTWLATYTWIKKISQRWFDGLNIQVAHFGVDILRDSSLHLSWLTNAVQFIPESILLWSWNSCRVYPWINFGIARLKDIFIWYYKYWLGFCCSIGHSSLTILSELHFSSSLGFF